MGLKVGEGTGAMVSFCIVALEVGLFVGASVVGIAVGTDVGTLVGRFVGKGVVGRFVGKGDGGAFPKAMHDSFAMLNTPRQSPSFMLFPNPSSKVFVPFPISIDGTS